MLLRGLYSRVVLLLEYRHMASYVPTIGLEIHAELKTHTKMFCSSRNDPNEPQPNVNICPVCLAHPGTLPAINAEAVKHVLKVGIALGARLADYTEFDRKNYFYPDLPKGYQLSQFEYPLVSGGFLKDVAITRVHLEEDTASSIHEEATGQTTIDYNRAGVPLMELVTDPVITSAQQAGDFARELQLLLRYLGVSEANMEKGEMRVEANVSVAPEGERSVAYVEIKNLNSFRTMEKAVEYEIERQIALLESGGAIRKETRGWDEAKQATFSQRLKEGSADYRYFPDPDLPSLKLSEIPSFSNEALTREMPELPSARRARYRGMGVSAEDAESYVRNPALGSFFDNASEGYDAAAVKLASNYIANDLVQIMRKRAVGSEDSRDSAFPETKILEIVPISPEAFRKIMDMLRDKKLSSRAAKDLLAMIVESGGEPQSLAEQHGLIQESDAAALASTVEAVIEAHPIVAADFRAGKAAALEFLLGQCMKALRGSGDPARLRSLLIEKLGS